MRSRSIPSWIDRSRHRTKCTMTRPTLSTFLPRKNRSIRTLYRLLGCSGQQHSSRRTLPLPLSGTSQRHMPCSSTAPLTAGRNQLNTMSTRSHQRWSKSPWHTGKPHKTTGPSTCSKTRQHKKNRRLSQWTPGIDRLSSLCTPRLRPQSSDRWRNYCTSMKPLRRPS